MQRRQTGRIDQDFLFFEVVQFVRPFGQGSLNELTAAFDDLRRDAPSLTLNREMQTVDLGIDDRLDKSLASVDAE